MRVLGFLVAAPLLTFVGAFLRAAILFWPTMILLGAVHTYLPWVPPLGAPATFLVVALISTLLPGSGDSTD